MSILFSPPSAVPAGGLRSLAWCLGLLLWALATCASAQDFPARPIRFVMSGGADQLARLVADELTARYGQAVYVDQKVGGQGTIAVDFVTKAVPDGYTWFMSTVSYTNQRVLQKTRPGPGELEPVTMIAQFPFILVVNTELPVHSVPELVAYAKARPGKLNFGSTGNGTPGHLCMEMLRQMSGIDMVHVPYKSVAQSLTDVMANQVQMMFIPAPAALQQIKAGKVRAIGVSTARRFRPLPDVPTVAEQGYPDYLYVSWNGVHAPPGTPPALLDRIAADVTAVISAPAAQERANAMGFDMTTMTRPEFTAFTQADLRRVAEVIKKGNIQQQD